MSCKLIQARTGRDYKALWKAWDKYDAALARVGNLKVYGRGSTVKAGTKARAAVDQADREVRAASAKVERSLAAMNKCLRRTIKTGYESSLNGRRSRRRRRR